jgi:hypothetical protein
MRRHWDGVLGVARLVIGAMSIAGMAGFVAGRARAAEPEPTVRELEVMVRKADFDAAERVAQRLLRSGGLARPEIARVYLQLGIVSSAKRDTAGAQAAFRKALRLDNDLRLSPSVGPHVAANLARAKASVSSSAQIDPVVGLSSVPGSGELSVETSARKDEDGLVRRVSVRIGDAREIRDLGEGPLRFSLVLPLTVTACASATASVLDEFGNELWAEIASAEVCRSPAPVPASANENADKPPPRSTEIVANCPEGVVSQRVTPPRSLSRAFWLAAAATGAAALGTTVLGLVALERRDEYHGSFTDGSTFEQQGRFRDLASTAQQRATVGAIATGLFAVTTVAFYIAGRF